MGCAATHDVLCCKDVCRRTEEDSDPCLCEIERNPSHGWLQLETLRRTQALSRSFIHTYAYILNSN